MPIWQCEGSIRRFDSDPHSVCPVLRTNARRSVTVYNRVLISLASARVGKGYSSKDRPDGPRRLGKGSCILRFAPVI
jgi:hypothetical protein